MRTWNHIKSVKTKCICSGLISILIFFIVPDKVYAGTAETDSNDYRTNNSFFIADSLAGIYIDAAPSHRYESAVRKAEWAAQRQQYEKAIYFFEQAIDIQPWKRLPHDRIEEIGSASGLVKIFFLPEIEFDKSSTLIRVLIIITIYSILSMFVLLAIIFFHRNQMEGESRLLEDLKVKYQLLLMDYIFNDEEQSAVPEKINKIAGDSYKRLILVEEMKDLIVNLSGDAAERLRELYYNLNLNEDSMMKAFSNKWHIKIKGFRELAFMNLKDANDEIIRCLHSNNSVLRMEAQLALVRLNDEDRFSFLDHLKRPFTMWEQMNVHEMIISYNLEIPDFQRWLNSDNRTVVIFALNMIKVFRQTHSREKVMRLLDSKDQEIRKTAISVLGELRIKEAVSVLKHQYKYEVYQNQLEILSALHKLSDESTLNFLIMVIDKEDDVQLQIEAAKAVRDMGEPGQQALEKLMKSDYKNYMIIIKHVLDKRI